MSGALTRMLGRSSASAAYSETATLGPTTGSSNYNASANEKGVISITVPVGGVWAKRLQIRINTTNGQSTSIMKPVVFQGGGTSAPDTATLFVDGLALTLPNISSLTTTDLWFNAGQTAVFFAAGDYWIGYHNGANAANVNVTALGSGVTKWNADTYSNGTASPFGASSTNVVTASFSMPYSLTGP